MKTECLANQILLVGNPNTGKTTLFNKITKSNEHVGNWHGVTVEEKGKSFKFQGKNYSLIDLPGIYSLHHLSYEEKVAIDYINSHKNTKIINICDINNLERNLYLSLCLIENGFDVVLAVNSTLKKPICIVDEKKLSKKLGVDVVLINAQSGEGIAKLLEKATQLSRVKKVTYCPQDMQVEATLKYEKISDILNETTKKTNEIYGKSKLDKILLNRFFAPIIFLGIMAFIFYLTFFLIGAPISSFLSYVLDVSVGKWTNGLFVMCFGSNSWVTTMVSEALIGGVGTVLSFLPQIVLLFFFLSALEDSGYLSRVAFVFDDMLSKIGLSGKSIYTLLLGFGCSASALLTARNMDNKKAKIKTILVTPFLSCSARLPIYLAIGGAFFGSKNIFVVMGLYLLGIFVTILVSTILNKTILKSTDQSFLLEFPPYRTISFKRAFKVLFENVKSFIFRIGGLLISMNVIVWILSNFTFGFSYVSGINQTSMLESIAIFIAPVFKPLGFSAWGLVVALLVGIIAKEGVVSSMMLFSGGSLALSLFSPTSEIYFPSSSAVLAFLTFCLLYVPCLSTIAVMRKEIGRKWTLFAVIMQLFTAYVFAMIAYNIGELCYHYGVIKILLIVFIILVINFAIFKVANVFRKQKCSFCKNCRKR